MADGEPPQRTSTPRASFRAMTEATKADWTAIAEGDAAFALSLPDWLLGHLSMLRDDRHGFAVDRLEHSLQTATRAHRAGHDEEYVVCALFHDIGSMLAPKDHGEFAALVLRPFISEQNHWMLANHAVFQGYYFFHFFGDDRHARDRFRDHPHFEYTAHFSHAYDQAAFDPDYDSMPLSAFEPIVRRLLAAPSR
jgi:predicted HD phosphohydrolase